MTTYSIRELRAKAGQILDSLAEGEEVIITRRGKPCARLAPIAPGAETPLTPLQEKYVHLPNLSFEEIQRHRAEMNDAWKAKFEDIPGDDAK